MEPASLPELDIGAHPELLHKPGDSAIPGYRLISPLGSGGFGEVWKCEAPGGIHKAIKFVAGQMHALDAGHQAVDQELQALQLVKGIRHPFLLSLDRVECVVGDLVIIMELADQSLHDRMADCRQEGLPGIPREELLEYLSEAAEVLDVMNFHHRLQHLDVKPGNLFLIGNHVKVGDFGVVQGLNSLAGSSDAIPAGITPVYAAPETFQGQPSQFSDQYSLAITYCELLTGRRPFDGKNLRQLMFQHTQEPPDLSALPPIDQPLLAKAMAKTPDERFASCLTFINALIMGRMPTPAEAQPLNSKRLIRRIRTGANGLLPLPVPPTPSGPPSTRHLSDSGKAGANATSDPAKTLPSADIRDLAAGKVTVVPGHQLVKCLARDSNREIWQIRGLDGEERLLKAYFNLQPWTGDPAAGPIARLADVQHVNVVPAEIVATEPDRLYLLSDLPRRSLGQRFHECRAKALSGIPRQELLLALKTVAETLDELFQRHSVHHLALSPTTILLAPAGTARLADFGTAHWFQLPAGQPVAKSNARYAAPELFNNAVSRSADVYSLALIYVEMLTGIHPFHNHQLDLTPLPVRDRAILSRALHKEPEQRFGSCREFIEALEALPRPPVIVPQDAIAFAGPAPSAPAAPEPLWGNSPSSNWQQCVLELIRLMAGTWQVQQYRSVRYLAKPAEAIFHRCATRLPLDAIVQKLERYAFAQQTRLESVEANSFLMQIQPSGFGANGKQGLLVKTTIQPNKTPNTATVLSFEVKSFGLDPRGADKVLKEFAPLILLTLREQVQARFERRTYERLPWDAPLAVRQVFPGGRLGESLQGRSKDLSLRGMGFFVSRLLAHGDILLRLPSADPMQPVIVPAKVVRVQHSAEGGFEIGVRFLTKSAGG